MSDFVKEIEAVMLPPSKDRWKLRSTTFQGLADAMANQWGNATPSSLLGEK